MMHYPGRLITFEGIDGSGKTEQAKRLSDFLKKTGYKVLFSREPGGDQFSEHLRDLLKHPEKVFTDGVPKIHKRTELLVFEAARANLVESLIKPALKDGKIVVLDRFMDSTWAYQGYGNGNNLNDILLLNRIAADGIRPDLTIFVDADPELVLSKSLDKAIFEKRKEEDPEYFKRIRAGYLHLSTLFPHRFKTVPRIEGEIEEMEKLVKLHVREMFTQPKQVTIYHAVKIANRNDDVHLQNSRRIHNVLKRYGRVFGDHFFNHDVVEYEEREMAFGINPLERDMMWIAQSDFIVYNIHPDGSIGVGREIDRARIAFDVPTISFYDETFISKDKITNSIKADESIKLIPFKSDNLEEVVEREISSEVSKMMQKPVLVSNPK